MRLVGMLDSPYVRRAAIAGTLLGLAFEHDSVSVFRQMDRFRAINPLIKAPSLVADDGIILMESGLIIQHMEDIAGRSLRPTDPAARLADLRLTGIAINACDKAVAIEYERKRPEDRRYAPWADRIAAQLDVALRLLDAEAAADRLLVGPGMRHGDIAAAVAWGFLRFVIPDVAGERDHPALARFAAACEATPAFATWPIDRE